MSILRYLYLSKADAIHYGFTHEGSLYGMPAYLAASDTPDSFIACPKVPLLQFVALTLDALFELFSVFLPADVEVETPYHFGEPLAKKPTTPEKQS